MASPEVEVATLKERMSNFDRNLQSLDKKVVDGFIEVKGGIDKLSAKLEQSHIDGDNRFVGKDDFITYQKQQDEKHNLILKQLGKNWVNNTLSALLGTVLASLVGAVIFFITRN